MFYLVSEKSEKLVVSLKIRSVNGMCNQRNNERSSEFDERTCPILTG